MNANVRKRSTDTPAMAPRPSFVGLLRAELRKLRRQRGNWAVLVGLTVFFLPFVPIQLANLGLQHDPERFMRWAALTSAEMCNTTVGIFLLLAGARLTGTEYSAGTVRVILAKGVGRIQLLAVKLAALVTVGVFLVASFVVLAGGAAYAIHLVWQAGPPSAAAWSAAGGAVAVMMISMVACILVPVAAGMLGRSTAFAVGVAMGFFAADNVAAILLDELATLTHMGFLHQVAGYLLGPNLNTLPGQVAGVRAIIAGTPLDVSLGHLLAVIGLWCAGLLVLSVAAARRDVSG
jgi:ABC-type transport system involved in multi-copper enzyme maturation permease subunit